MVTPCTSMRAPGSSCAMTSIWPPMRPTLRRRTVSMSMTRVSPGWMIHFSSVMGVLLGVCISERLSPRTPCPSSPTSKSTASAFRPCSAARSCACPARERLRPPDLPIRRSPALEGKRVLGFRRLGKRIVFDFEEDLFLVVHLMIAGRFLLEGPRRGDPEAARAGGVRLRTCDAHPHRGRHEEARELPRRSRRGRLSSRSRAAASSRSRCRSTISATRSAGEPHAEASADRPAALQRHRQRLLRRDPASRAAVAGEAHVAAHRRGDRSACRDASQRDPHRNWTDRLRRGSRGRVPREGHRVSAGDGRPRQSTASRARCCGTKVQRIRYAANEVNYCPRCQTDGKVLADRGLSRLLARRLAEEHRRARRNRGPAARQRPRPRRPSARMRRRRVRRSAEAAATVFPDHCVTRDPMRVRFFETDLMGIVHHATYLTYVEAGRVEYLRASRRRLPRAHRAWVPHARRGGAPRVQASRALRRRARRRNAPRRADSRHGALRLSHPARRRRARAATTLLACVDDAHKPRRIPPDVAEMLRTQELPKA